MRKFIFAILLVVSTANPTSFAYGADGLCKGFASNTTLSSSDRMHCEAFSLFERGEFTESMDLLEKLVSEGSADAKFLLGRLLYLGQHNRVDLRHGKTLIDEAADEGSIDAQVWLFEVNFLQEDPVAQEQAALWATKLQKGGHTVGAYFLGKLYLTGTFVEKDYAQARKFFEYAGTKEFEGAYIFVADLYERGLGGPQELFTALRVYRYLTSQGGPQSQVRCADIHRRLAKTLSGEKSREALVIATKYFLIAVDQGEPSARDGLARLSNEFDSLPQDRARKEADEWFAKAFDSQDREFGLAASWCRENGIPLGDCKATAIAHHRCCRLRQFSPYYLVPYEFTSEYALCRKHLFQTK